MRSFAFHCATGLLAVAAHYAVMWLLLRFGVNAVAASAVGFLCGAAVRFLFAHFAVFAPAQRVRATLAKFGMLLLVQLGSNSLLLTALVAMDVPVWWAQVAVTIFLTFINYAVYRLWVFK